jgi:polyferredoxin
MPKGESMLMSESIIVLIQRYSWLMLVVILLWGWFIPVLMFTAFICMIAPVVFSFKYGRAWCGNFCPRGSFNNNVLKIISPNKTIPNILKKPVIRIFTFIALMSLFTYSILSTNGSLLGIGIVFIKMMAITTLIEISMGVLIHHNSWCTICPMGTVAGTITRIKGKAEGVITISEKCIGCQTCVSVCPMQIDIPKYQKSGMVTNSDCMKCRKCIGCCKQDALQWEMN